MSKFNITLAVPAEALPSLITDLSEYDAELVRVENAEEAAPRALPAPATVEGCKRASVGRGADRAPAEVSGAARPGVGGLLCRSSFTTTPRRSVRRRVARDGARGVNVTVRPVYGHLQRFRIMGCCGSSRRPDAEAIGYRSA